MNCLSLKVVLSTAALASAVLCGCSHRPDLAGKWAGTAPIQGSGTAAYTYDFHDDGLVAMSVKTSKGAAAASPIAAAFLGDVTNIHVAATYTVKDDVLTITPKTITLLDDKGQPPLITPTVKQEPQINRYKISGDTLTLDRLDGDKPLTLTRQKSTE